MSFAAEPTRAIEVFYSYAHEDERFRKSLETHLSSLKRRDLISGWNACQIIAGQEWEQEINTHLKTAQIILLLISPDFIASDYINTTEMKQAMERHEAGEARVIPIILRPSDWEGTSFAKLQMLPTNAKPVTKWTDRDSAYMDIAQGIRKAVEELKTSFFPNQSFPPVTSPQPDPTISQLPYQPPKDPSSKLEEQNTSAQLLESKDQLGVGDTHNKDKLNDNPFTYGNPISDPKHFFGRRHEIDQVFSRLRNVEFESSSIVGERRIGKTSLLNFLMHPEVRHIYGLDSDKYLFIYLDLQIINKDTTPLSLWKQWLQRMIRNCQDAEVKLKLEEMRAMDTIDNFAIADLFDSIDERGLYVVLLLDEFENVTANQNFDAAFFYGLRALAIHHHLSLITSSRRELIELCHSETIRSSPFFNIFANINLRLFSKEEANSFIDQLLAGTKVQFTNEELDLIFRNAGYHPYFLQIACHFLFEAYSNGLAPEEREKFMSKAFREEASPHFDDYWHNCYNQEKIVLTALALLKRQQRKVGGGTFSLEHLQEIYSRSEQTIEHLEKRGLIISESDRYSLFGLSFCEWICNEITDTIDDQESYENWRKSNKSVLERLSTKVKTELGDILPKINDKYRELIITWVSDPRNLFVLDYLKLL